MSQTATIKSRLLPTTELPAYTYIPGSTTPHPLRDPQGHRYGRNNNRNTKALDPDAWADNRNYLMAIDFFNHGYYWESHDKWDRLWRAWGPVTTVARFLKGLVKLAASGVIVRE
jgi:hypothetical protein